MSANMKELRVAHCAGEDLSFISPAFLEIGKRRGALEGTMGIYSSPGQITSEHVLIRPNLYLVDQAPRSRRPLLRGSGLKADCRWKRVASGKKGKAQLAGHELRPGSPGGRIRETSSGTCLAGSQLPRDSERGLTYRETDERTGQADLSDYSVWSDSGRGSFSTADCSSPHPLSPCQSVSPYPSYSRHSSPRPLSQVDSPHIEAVPKSPHPVCKTLESTPLKSTINKNCSSSNKLKYLTNTIANSPITPASLVPDRTPSAHNRNTSSTSALHYYSNEAILPELKLNDANEEGIYESISDTSYNVSINVDGMTSVPLENSLLKGYSISAINIPPPLPPKNRPKVAMCRCKHVRTSYSTEYVSLNDVIEDGNHVYTIRDILHTLSDYVNELPETDSCIYESDLDHSLTNTRPNSKKYNIDQPILESTKSNMSDNDIDRGPTNPRPKLKNYNFNPPISSTNLKSNLSNLDEPVRLSTFSSIHSLYKDIHDDSLEIFI